MKYPFYFIDSKHASRERVKFIKLVTNLFASGLCTKNKNENYKWKRWALCESKGKMIRMEQDGRICAFSVALGINQEAKSCYLVVEETLSFHFIN